VVTGIGHEIDFTIADFAADARAPTPSAAAESVVPDRHTWVAALDRSAQRLAAAMRRELRGAVSRLDTALQRLSLAHPGVRLASSSRRLDDLEQRISHALRSELHHKRGRLADVFARLVRHSPDRLVRDLRVRHELFAATPAARVPRVDRACAAPPGSCAAHLGHRESARHPRARLCDHHAARGRRAHRGCLARQYRR